MRRYGIDLGTTNTCVYEAFFSPSPEEGQTRADTFQLNPVKIYYENDGGLIARPLQDRMPSVIYGRKNRDSGEYEFYLGEVANLMAHNDNSPVIINTKRLFGKDLPQQELLYDLTAEDVARKFLEGCRYSIEKKVKKTTVFTVADFCITQPAAFNLFASLSIRAMAKNAGFRKHEALREPIAAMMSFLYDILAEDPEELFRKQQAHGGRLLTLVVDIGGGTTDVTIQELSVSGTEEVPPQGCIYCTGYSVKFLNFAKENKKDRTPVASASLDPAFGGMDFDRVIVQHIMDDWGQKYADQNGHNYNWKSLEGENIQFRLYGKIQDFKISLSDHPDNKSSTEVSDYLDGKLYSSTITSDQVYEWTQSLCESSFGSKQSDRTVYGIILDTIRYSGYKVDNIDYIFVTGGMSSFLPIRQMIEKNFARLVGNNAIYFSKHPLDDIARGAAVCNCFFQVEMPQTILYADLMLDDPEGIPRVLVKKNTPLPVENQVIENFMELTNPVNLYVDVLWGHDPRDCHMRRLRRLFRSLPGDRIEPKGTKISVKYSIDVHQAMKVELIIHSLHGDFSVVLLDLIKDFNLSEGEGVRNE